MTVGNLLQNPQYKEKFVMQKLLCLFLRCTREELWTDIERQLDDGLTQKILSAYDDYVVKKKPLEYVLGYVEFFGNKFMVNEATLIPRPETEYMITAVNEFIDEEGEEMGVQNILMDIGTGCGVLGISLLLENHKFFSEAIFTDYYANALEMAKKNYESLIKDYQGKAEFIQSDLLAFANPPASPFFKGDGVILVANLPYIPEETFDANVADNVKEWEPKPAFVGGDDGLKYYRIMLDQLISLKLPNVTCFLEMMTWQVDVLRQEFDQYFSFEEVKTFHFNIRIVKVLSK